MYRVFYINHYGAFGGAQRSLLELVKHFPEESVKPLVVTPKGRVVDVLERTHIETITVFGISKFDHTRVGYYKGWRWLILLRELIYGIFTLIAFARNSQKLRKADIVHLNENTCVFPMYLAKKIWRKPTILHARAVMNNDVSLWRTRWLGRLFRKYADAIIAIDENVAASLPQHPNIYVVHNGMSLNGVPSEDPSFEKRLSEIQKRKLNIGFVGVLDRNKGIFELMEAVQRCVELGMDINLLVLGNFVESGKKVIGLASKEHRDTFISELVDSPNLKGHFHLLGFTTAIHAFYEYIDVICFPTYYDAPGRPIFEAAFFGKPSILAVSQPRPDTFIDGETGIRVNVGDADSIVRAVKDYYEHPEWLAQHGAKAKELAVKNFDSSKNAKAVLDIYQSLLN